MLERLHKDGKTHCRISNYAATPKNSATNSFQYFAEKAFCGRIIALNYEQKI